MTTGIVHKLKSFYKDSSGQLVLMFALSATPLLMAAGVAVDYGGYLSTKTQLQSISDGAALAATAEYLSKGAEANLDDVASAYVSKNIEMAGISNLEGIRPIVSLTGEHVNLKLSGNYKTSFMSIFDVDTISLDDPNEGRGAGGSETGSDPYPSAKIKSQVALPVFNETYRGEIAMTMDYSGSMGEYIGGTQKYITMRNEVNTLFSRLSQNGSNDYVKFGLIPFSSAVRTTMTSSYYQGAGSGSTRCIRDRLHPFNMRSTTPGTVTAADLPLGVPVSSATHSRFVVTDCPSALGAVRAMGNDFAAINTQVNGMLPSGNTHVALGLETAWHILTPNAPYTEGVSSLTDPYETLKAVILLTDGAQTSTGYGPPVVERVCVSSYYDSSRGRWICTSYSDRTVYPESVSQANANFVAACTAMKATGIRIITVAFDLDDAPAVTRLRNCASEDPKVSGVKLFWDAQDNPQLAKAFADIRKHLIRDLYVSR